MGINVVAGYGSYHDPVFFKLQKGRTRKDQSSFNLSDVQLPLKYLHGVLLNKEELRDIKDLTQFISAEHVGFYEELFSSQEQMGKDMVDLTEEDDPDDDLLDY
ncbi:hypothetical protein Pcinc_002633 [Petrolisthes cinctipes]|uniref:Uncharacterized protein n=1 Tax=Petrolisthes cinctipes TaxID=88211 RepID=A0AAE1GPZ1_PETCI|nr:hypothetical protein Pcinc_008886 [Petrolisthes cinctipes]KAK3893568.1 hypothetical protein Pcinc_002633 [Petrolisthes cinctipes]